MMVQLLRISVKFKGCFGVS